MLIHISVALSATAVWPTREATFDWLITATLFAAVYICKNAIKIDRLPSFRRLTTRLHITIRVTKKNSGAES